jgi:hypothetical protein
MKHRPILIAAIFAGLAVSMFTQQTNASDWTGIYARVDKVVFEPNESAPERIQIWGAFALATKDSRYDYDAAQRGYLYFSVKPGKEEVCRKEWADLKAVAGTGQIVGFGGRNQPAKLRKIGDSPATPDVYPVDHGLTKVNDNRGDYAPIRDLKSVPKER